MNTKNMPQSMGSLASNILTSTKASMNIGQTGTGGEKLSSTGLELTKPGSGINLPPAFINAQDPWAATKALLASLRPQATFSIKWEKDPTNLTPRGYEVTGNRALAAMSLRATLQPAPREILLKALTKMAALVAMPKQDQGSLKLKVAAYAEQLESIPGDMALYALKKWPSKSKWFPTWNELYSLIEPELRDRRMMLDACDE